MAKETLLGSIELTKLNNVFIKNFKSKDGSIVPCICIPQESNNIKEFPVKVDGVIQEDQNSNRFGIEVRIVIREEKDVHGSDGFISQKLSKEDYNANKDNAEYLKSSQPIIGNFIKLKSINPDAPGDDITVLGEEDDNLPF